MPKDNFKSFGDLLSKRAPAKKAPAYEWQDLALRIIKELNIPGNKRGSVFQICKKFSKPIVEKALNDTKELCKTGEQWRYFFKIVGKKPDTPQASTKLSSGDLPF
ncbi:MAG TPA: hypothetical protein VF817_04800 [Patescibacteria group bacterium]